jgi:hypothetical protein
LGLARFENILDFDLGRHRYRDYREIHQIHSKFGRRKILSLKRSQLLHHFCKTKSSILTHLQYEGGLLFASSLS